MIVPSFLRELMFCSGALEIVTSSDLKNYRETIPRYFLLS
jgi:hypothetical protein